MDVDPPVRGRAWYIHAERQDGVLREAEGFHQDRQPGADFGDTDGRDGNRLAVGGASNAQARLIRIQGTQALEISLEPGFAQLADQLFNLRAIGHRVPLAWLRPREQSADVGAHLRERDVGIRYQPTHAVEEV